MNGTPRTKVVSLGHATKLLGRKVRPSDAEQLSLPVQLATAVDTGTPSTLRTRRDCTIHSTFNSACSIRNQKDISMLPFLDGVSTTDDPTLLITVLMIILLSTLAVSKVGRKRDRDPPLAPGGIFKTAEMISGKEFPWFMLRTMQELNSSVFRMSLPIPGTPMVVAVGELETVREILTDPLSKKPAAIFRSMDNITNGHPSIISLDGEPWAARRKSTAPAFSSHHIRRKNRVAVEKTEIWIKEKLRPMVEEGKSFDVAKEMIGITLSAICETAFEYDMPDEEKSLFVSELDFTLKQFMFKTMVNPLRKVFGPFLADRRRALQASKNVSNISRNIMDAYRRLEAPEKDTIIDRIMKSDAYKNDDERLADMTVFLIAGHDTTAYSLAWILLELARNPMQMTKLRESLSNAPPEDWSRSEVLRIIVKEGLRLHPVVPGGSIRTIGRDIETKTGMLLPKGSIIFMPFIMLLRNPIIFENENTFQPSRWEKPSKEMADAFLPFSLGKQNCIGQSLANAELHCIVARICAEFDLKVKEEGTVDYFLTLKPAGARLIARKAA
jgi:cytochrome P450